MTTHTQHIEAAETIRELRAQVEALTAYNATRTNELVASVAQAAALKIESGEWQARARLHYSTP